MIPANQIVLTGRLIEAPKPGRKGTALFMLECRFAWQSPDGDIGSSGFALWCRAWGHAANSVLKYGKPGVEIIAHGRLAYLPEVDQLGIVADSIAFISPREVMEVQADG